MSEAFEQALAQEESAARSDTLTQVTASHPKPVYTTFADLGELIPEEEDPSVFFRNNWLGQGGGLILTAPSGVGKSSLVIQMLLNWQQGHEFLACPLKPLKCALVQSEDSRRDMQEIKLGMSKGLLENGRTQSEIDRAFAGIHIWTCVGKTGTDFTDWLHRQQSEDPCDVIAINPIQGFFGGDISKQEDASRFLREGLDPILKGEGGTKPCMTVLVQHTTKMSGRQKEGNSTLTDYGEYLGAGSHEFTDWARACIGFIKHKSAPGTFVFKATKRGSRLKWKDANGQNTTERIMTHAKDYIFWLEVKDSDELKKLNGTSQESAPSPRSLKSQERTDNDHGTEENAIYLVKAVRNSVNAGVIVNNQLIREWASDRWKKIPGRTAVARFEEIRGQHGIGKDEQGNYTITTS